jgi:hypothetical protein
MCDVKKKNVNVRTRSNESQKSHSFGLDYRLIDHYPNPNTRSTRSQKRARSEPFALHGHANGSWGGATLERDSRYITVSGY